MAAHREQSELVLFGKLAEANSTIKWLLQTHNLLVVENRKSVYKSLIQTRIMEVKELLKLSLKSIGCGEFWVSVRLRGS